MSVYRQLIHEIEEIPFPPEHLDDLKQLGPLMIKGMERDGLPIESGNIDLGKLDKPLDRAFFLFMWISENNGVIENLNMVLNDMRSLPTDYILSRGSPKTRFYLLVRTYFHEFYRFREIHSHVLKAVANRGYVKKEEVPLARKAFHDAFETTIKLRNSLVHGSPTWKGQDHFDLNLVSMAWERGYALKDQKTGAIWEIADVLKGICNSTADVLRDEGTRVSSVLKNLVRIYVGILSEV